MADDLDLVVDNLRGENLAVENNLEVPRHWLGDRHIVAEIQDLKIFLEYGENNVCQSILYMMR